MLLGKRVFHVDEQPSKILLERRIPHLAMGTCVLLGDALGAVEIEVKKPSRAGGVARVALNFIEDVAAGSDDSCQPLA
jgi:hypothetical protein